MSYLTSQFITHSESQNHPSPHWVCAAGNRGRMQTVLQEDSLFHRDLEKKSNSAVVSQ